MPTPRRTLRAAAAILGAIVMGASLTGAASAGDVLGDHTRLFVDHHSTTYQAARSLHGQAKLDALLLARYPGATWFTGGTPAQVRSDVRDLVRRTGRSVPVLVAYDLPYRDCGQYSSGGALSTADYAAWIEAFAAGIGNRPAVVILEPDGLGLIPNYTSELDASQNCVVDGPEATPEARFAQLNHAVDVLGALPHTAVYLDATHSSWQNVSESAFRLLKAGVQRADGFFLNASNYEYTTNQVFYGTWISQCIETAVTSAGWTGEPVAADFPDCANQYWNGGPTARPSPGCWARGPASRSAPTVSGAWTRPTPRSTSPGSTRGTPSRARRTS